MLLAMLNRAKAQRIIPRHHLEGVPVPQVVHEDEPEPWSRLELGILMGPALREYEAEQAVWNARVAQEKKNRGLRSPSFIPLRGLCLIGYYTLMRPASSGTAWSKSPAACSATTSKGRRASSSTSATPARLTSRSAAKRPHTCSP
jgi:hypothetical protein